MPCGIFFSDRILFLNFIVTSFSLEWELCRDGVFGWVVTCQRRRLVPSQSKDPRTLITFCHGRLLNECSSKKEAATHRLGDTTTDALDEIEKNVLH